MIEYDLYVAGLSEIGDYAPPRVDHVVSYLDPGYPADHDLAPLEGATRIEFLCNDIIEDIDGMVAPEREAIVELLAFGGRLRDAEPAGVLVHCHAGISRSTAAAAILMAQFNPGRETDLPDALTGIRPQAWPNSRMIRFADELLERDGALIAAMETVYRRACAARPDIVPALRRFGRGAEIPANFE